MEAIGREFPLFPSVAGQEFHPTDKARGEQQMGIVDKHRAVLVGEMLFVEVGELVVFDMAMAVGFFIFDDVSLARHSEQVLSALALRNVGKAALDGGTEKRGGMLHGLEESALSELRFRFLVVDLRRTTTAKGLAEAGVIDAVADGARLLDDGWFDFCHCIESVIALTFGCTSAIAVPMPYPVVMTYRTHTISTAKEQAF